MDFNETKCEVFKADEKTKLFTRMWLPDDKPRAVFIAIHGGMAHAGDWVTPAIFFKEKGIATYALDLRWHGTYPQYNKNGKVFFHTDSYDQYAEDIHNFYKWVKEKNPDTPVFILSHSNGALIALYYGLTIAKDTDYKGVIVSSPWLENKVEVPKPVLMLSKIISKIAPKFSVVPEPLNDKLTHDKDITARHYRDEEIGLRGKKVSAKLGVESLKTQGWVLDNIKNWDTFPLFAVIAGQDALAVPETSIAAVNSIPEDLRTIINYENNYHENFNEVNREEVYGKIWDWMMPLM